MRNVVFGSLVFLMGSIISGCNVTVEDTSQPAVEVTPVVEDVSEAAHPVRPRVTSNNPFERFTGIYEPISDSFRQNVSFGECAAYDELKKIKSLVIKKWANNDYHFQVKLNQAGSVEHLIQEYYERSDAATRFSTMSRTSSAQFAEETTGNGVYQLKTYDVEYLGGLQYKLSYKYHLMFHGSEKTCVTSVKLKIKSI
jgi:hypothetical protein